MKRRAHAALAAVVMALLFATAGPASAETRTVRKTETNWFWASQQRSTPSEVTGGCPEGAPVCPDPQVGAPNTHGPGRLPVQVAGGEDEKVSAVRFDLSFLPPQGAAIDRFTFTVKEATDAPSTTQSFNQQGQRILACAITDIWSASEDGADDMDDAPPYDCKRSSVVGKRSVRKGTPLWRFDVTSLATAWGEDPFGSNHGVMLVGRKGPEENWQLVLGGPSRDDPQTPENERKLNAGNIVASIRYTPNPEPAIDGAPADGGFGASDSALPGGDGALGGDGAGDLPAAEPEPVEQPAEEEAVAPTQTPARDAGPPTPLYVWAVIPIGLLALAIVRSVLLEPVSRRRPDGVLALIRQHNAARRGEAPAPDAVGPISRLGAFLRSAASARRSGGSGPGGHSARRGERP